MREKIRFYKVGFYPSVWLKARQKAELRSLAAIIRELVDLWLDGHITLPSEKEK